MHWNKAVFYNEPNISGIIGVGNSGIVYSKEAWLKIGKSPLENAGGDQTLTAKLRALDTSKIVHAEPPNSEVSWWYRWATPQNYHQCGMGTDTDTDSIQVSLWLLSSKLLDFPYFFQFKSKR